VKIPAASARTRGVATPRWPDTIGPLDATLPTELDGYEIRYRRARWKELRDLREGPPPAKIRTTSAVLLDNGSPVGEMEFCELAGDPTDPDEFARALDNESVSLGNLACAILSEWPTLEVFRHAPALVFRGLELVDRKLSPQMWQRLGRLLIDAMSPRCSVAIWEAFLGSSPVNALELGLRPFAASHGDEGYMWRSLSPV
jgi:hypothetical protein